MWRVVFAKQAQKDAKKLSAAGLRHKAEQLIKLLRENPYETPPPKDTGQFPIQKCVIFFKFYEINELFGCVLVYGAKVIPPIDADLPPLAL
jgi:hypothetical protein